MTVTSRFRQALPYLPLALQTPLSSIPPADAAEIQEIRLRLGKQLHVVRRGRESLLTPDGRLCPEPAPGVTVTRQMLDITFQNVCSHSLHSCQNAIRQGFVTIAGGCRVGLCGTAVLQNGTLETIRAVSGMNLRIASERTGCAEQLLRRLGGQAPGGLLLTGAPASGKTTLLRDLARVLGETQRVCIVDERGELAAVQNGEPQFTLGCQTDVLDGYPKADGIAIAVRVLSPELLICDEIGGEAETEAMLMALHTGVQLIASAHAGSIDELYDRPQLRRLIAAGVFRQAVLLGTGSQCGQVLAAAPLEPR